jgi:hypothetical protein
MSDHALVEGLSGLASRVENLEHLAEGEDSRRFADLLERLTKITLEAIGQDLEGTNQQYQDAVSGVQAAIGVIGAADKKIQNVSAVITAVAKAADLAEKVLTKAVV